MSPEISQHLSKRIREFSEFVTKPEATNFDDSQLWDSLSTRNQQLLSPVRQEFRLHNACLNQVRRWQDHPYQKYLGGIGDTDFEHVVKMIEISHQLKNMNLLSFDFNNIDLKIIFHDSGEIITDDMSVIHPSKIDTFVTNMKHLEPHGFIHLILSQIKHDQPEIYQTIKTSYTSYEAKDQNLNDKESWLVKFIDTLQGDEYGVSHIYNPSVLDYPHMVSIKNPHELIQLAMENENKFLSNVIRSSTISLQDKNILTGFLFLFQQSNYGQKDSPYYMDYLASALSC